MAFFSRRLQKGRKEIGAAIIVEKAEQKKRWGKKNSQEKKGGQGRRDSTFR